MDIGDLQLLISPKPSYHSQININGEKEGCMRSFNYTKLLDLDLPANIYELIAGIYEYKGKQEFYVRNFSYVLEKMVEVVKI